MTAVMEDQQVSDCPPDNETMLAEYLPYVIRLVQSRGGIPAQDAEDVAHDIMARLIERNILGMYVPGTVDYGGVKRRLTFRNFLSAMVLRYCRGKRDTIQRLASREVLASEQASEVTWLEALTGGRWDDYSSLDAAEFVTRMRAYLATIPRRSQNDSCNLLALFDELVREVQEDGTISYATLRSRFPVADTTLGAWVSRLRQVMTGAPEALEQPLTHVIGGVTLTLADVRMAIDILEASAGIMVAQPLRRAGHPLAQATRGWYHELAKAEQQLYPDIRVDARTHRQPAGHVKQAVVHRLQRMLGILAAETPAPPDVVPPEPEPEPEGPRDFLEAELFRQGLSSAAVDRCLALADQMSLVSA